LRFRDFLFGQPIDVVVSDSVSPRAIAAALKPEIASFYWPFSTKKIVGRLTDERLSLEWRGSAFLLSNTAPRMRGRLLPHRRGTRFEGVFGAPAFLKFFLAAWLCFDALFALVGLSGGAEGSTMPLWVWPLLVVHAAAPFGISAIGMVGADNARDNLLAFLHRANP
jgi:hypothetical protein